MKYDQTLATQSYDGDLYFLQREQTTPNVLEEMHMKDNETAGTRVVMNKRLAYHNTTPISTLRKIAVSALADRDVETQGYLAENGHSDSVTLDTVSRS